MEDLQPGCEDKTEDDQRNYRRGKVSPTPEGENSQESIWDKERNIAQFVAPAGKQGLCIEKPFNACIGQRVERKIEWVKRPVQDQEYGTIK